MVRTAAANLQGRYVKLAQTVPGKDEKINKLEIKEYKEAPATALRIVANKSHSGTDMGIMASVRKKAKNNESEEIVDAILDCIKVNSKDEYDALCEKFVTITAEVQQKEILEIETSIFRAKRYFIHDRFSMVIFKLVDTEGFAVSDFDLILTVYSYNFDDYINLIFIFTSS